MRGVIGEIARDDRAATAIEYALLAGLIALAVLTAVATLGESLTNLFEFIRSQI